MRYGYGTKVDRLLEQLAQDIHADHAFGNVAVITIDEETTFVLGLATNRLDGYGITKAHVTTAKRELSKLGVALQWDEVDGLLHHAEAHRAQACDCDTGSGDYVTERTRMGMTSAEKMRALRERARLAGYCLAGGKSHGKATRGTICEECYQYGLGRKKQQRQCKKEERSVPNPRRSP